MKIKIILKLKLVLLVKILRYSLVQEQAIMNSLKFMILFRLILL